MSRRTLEQRLAQKFLIGDGCWEWTAGKSHGKSRGYGKISVEGAPRMAHRAVYEWLVGPIPPGLTLDHLCRNRGCVRPDHLEPVTLAENIRRADLGAIRRAKTHCPQGHPYDEANTYNDPAGQRHCRTCRRAAGRAYDLKHGRNHYRRGRAA